MSVRRSTRLSSVNKTPSTTWRAKTTNKISDDSEDEVENLIMNTPSTRKGKGRKVASKPVEAEDAEPKTPSTRKAKGRPKKVVQVVISDEEQSNEEEALEVSPPKQRRFSKKAESLFSPTRLLDRLSIDDRPDEAQLEKTKEMTLEMEKRRNKYQNARRVLNSAETNFLPGREKELAELEEFMRDHLDNKKSGSLYVSGQPGTGKTACLTKLLKSEEFAPKFVKVYINCTSISTIGSIYKKICAELNLKVAGRTEKDHLAAIDKYLVTNHKMVLMVLDEVDQLCGQKQAVLYTIFEWPAKPNTKLLLIGIANSLDLTDRMLMRLNANCELKPKLMHFSSYTKQQIVEIFKSRLEEAGVMDIFPPVTIQLLAAKVSAVSGDVRRALDIGRRVVEIAEQQKKDGDKLNINLSEFGIEQPQPSELKPVQVTQVVTVLNKVYGASQALNDDIDDSFPLQQKIMLCSLMLMLRKEKNKDITVGRLHDVYRRVCTKRNILPVDQAEFVGLCALVETRGIVRIVSKKEPRLCKVQLQWDDEEVNGALRDKQLIASILDDVSCLGR